MNKSNHQYGDKQGADDCGSKAGDRCRWVIRPPLAFFDFSFLDVRPWWSVLAHMFRPSVVRRVAVE